MKTIIQLSTMVLLMFFAINSNAQSKTEITTTTFACKLHCHSCKDNIMKNIPYENGVKDVSVDMKKQQVTVKFKTSKNDTKTLIKAFKKLGFDAVVKTDSLPASKN